MVNALFKRQCNDRTNGSSNWFLIDKWEDLAIGRDWARSALEMNGGALEFRDWTEVMRGFDWGCYCRRRLGVYC